MKGLTMVVGVALAGGIAVSGHAVAQCKGPWLNQQQLQEVFSGNTVCANNGSDSWQEYHAPDGRLIDYKMGPNDPVDPSKQVGTWLIRATGANARLVYDYGAGGTSDFRVHLDGGSTYSLCGTGEQTVTVRSGQVQC